MRRDYAGGNWMKPDPDPARLLQSYANALSRLDGEALDSLFGSDTLLEIPFLKPGRLVGSTEIAAGHREILANLEAVDCRIEHCLADAGHAIAEGQLEVTRRGEAARRLAIGMVAECGDAGLRRLSLYCNTRGLRRWSDKTIQ
jgi:hypothetical protein